MSKLKAFVRYDGTGRIVPSSVILAKSKPKVGNWTETTAYECCNYVPTTTTTTTLDPLCRLFSITSTGRKVLSGINCNGNAFSQTIDRPSAWKVWLCDRSINTIPGATIVNHGVCTGCYTFSVAGGEELPPTIAYIDCDGNVQTVSVGTGITVCAQGFPELNTNVTYIGPCPL